MEENNEEVIVNDTSVDTTNPTTDVENTEEVVGTLEDTSEAGTSEAETDNQESVEDERKFTQQDVDRMLKSRVRRLENENLKKMQEYENLVNTLKAGIGQDIQNVSELDQKFKDFYKGQGIDIPEVKNRLSERDEKILAKADAEEIIEAGEDEINKVASEIHNKPVDKRTAREKIIYETLGKHVMMQKAQAQLKEKGADIKILEDSNFKNFASKFSASTPLGEIYDMYNKINAPQEVKKEEKKTPPASTGSVKTTGSTNEIKEHYTPEEVSKMTMEQLKNNPRLMKAVEKSMAEWNK